MNSEKEDQCLDVKRIERSFVIAMNSDRYSDNIKAYDDYLNFVAYLIKVLCEPKNALSAAYATSILVRDGIFSKNGNFRYTYPMDNHIEGHLGLNVVNGYGNSRNISSFINDVLTKMGYMAYTIYGRVSSEGNLNDDQKKANQALNLIEYHDNLYAFDAINNVFYSFTEKDKMKEIYNDRPLYAYYNPRADMVLNNLSADNVQSLMSVFDNAKDKEIISQSEFNSMIDYTNRQIYRKALIVFDETVRYSKQYIDKIISGLPGNVLDSFTRATASDKRRKKK